jgi:hypothetical protein
MIIAEEFEQCDDATGCWVFRGAWVSPHTKTTVKTQVMNYLIQQQHLRWMNVKNEHPASFFEDNAKEIFNRDWRVRRVAAGQVLPVGY